MYATRRGCRASRCAKRRIGNREVLLNVSALLSTEYVRQDVNLTIQILVNGEVKQTEQWRSLTIGTDQGAAAYIPFGGSSPKVREESGGSKGRTSTIGSARAASLPCE
jgi:hypothetical protein